MFSPEAILTLVTIAFCFAFLILSRIATDIILLAGVAALILMGVISPEEGLVGLSNEGMATVAVLFIVARGLSQSGVVDWLSNYVLGRPKSTASAQFRLMGSVSIFSSILNNTPVVAMLVPAVNQWAKRNNLKVSQLMIPLSYAAIIGGTCTIVGTSTNLVINDMMQLHLGETVLNMFDLAWVGLPCVIVVILFTLLTSRFLLPSHGGSQDEFGDAREYIVEMLVKSNSPIVGQSIEDAGLRQLPGMFLVEIERAERTISAVTPQEILKANDRLIFAGDVRSVVDLKNIKGLKIAEQQVFKIDSEHSSRRLVEVVISSNFPSLNQTVRDSRFRNNFNAAIIAVARDGERLKGKIGDIILRAGDTLLLETHADFASHQRYSKSFLLVSEIENSMPVLHEKRNLALVILVAMVALVTLGTLSMFKAAVLAAVMMVLTKCLSIQDARQSIDWQVLLVIAASIGLGVAMNKTGAAQSIAEVMIGLSAGSAYGSLAMLFILTTVFSAVISNLAAAVLLFPLAVAASQQLDVSLLPFGITLMIAASTCFSTPIGYQTNLMVYGPGNYRFMDFVRIGSPLTVLVGIVSLILVPIIWPF